MVFRKLTLISLLILSFASFLIIESCKHDPEIFATPHPDPGGGNDHPCDPDSVYFENEILPLIVSSCATTDCHGTVNPQDDIILADYASIIDNGKIKPGDPEGSKLFKVINEAEPQDRMPPEPNEPLTAEQINKVRKWIEQGALNNSCDNECDSTNVTYTENVWPIIESKCFGCHSGNNPGGNIFLRNYTDVVVVADDERLWGSINHETGFTAMPKNLPKLSECELAAIRIWIEEGAQDN